MRQFILRVERAPSPGGVQVGEVFEVESKELVIGRAARSHVRLNDPSVSSHHATLRAQETGFVLENSSVRGSTWLDQRALTHGEEVYVAEVAWLQLGHVLLHVSIAAHTTPVETMYSLPPSPGQVVRSSPTMFLEVDAGLHPSVHLMGHEQSLFPMALRLLWRLCQTAGEVVTHDELKDTLSPTASKGGLNVPQNITYIRDMFEEAIEVGELTEEDLRHELEAQLGSTRVESMGRRELLRMLVQSVRGRGYRLNLTLARVTSKG